MNLGDAASRYLTRLGVDVRGRGPDLDLLRELQTAHVMAVPFENLDVFDRLGVATDPAVAIAKIVDRRRGGWCFELNGAFGSLLHDLGFHASYVSCRVFDDGEWGPDLDHCALIVTIDAARWFVDVGFGDCCMIPIPLEQGVHDGVPRPVRLSRVGTSLVLAERFGRRWIDQLDIQPTPRTMNDFTARSAYLQTEPGLAWTAKPFATRATASDGSRVTLRNGVLRIRTGAGDFVDTPIDDSTFAALLTERFGIERRAWSLEA